MKSILALVIFLLMIIASCNINNNRETTITQRIQYDVTIKSPDPDLNWWVQNIEGMHREEFIKGLLESTYQGKVKAYDAFLLTELSPEQVRNIGHRSETLRLQRPVPPYGYYDTIVRKELNIHEITKIRFLEEWNITADNMQIKKNVLGIAPLLESYDETGNLRGYMPMFWLFFDSAYPSALQGKVR